MDSTEYTALKILKQIRKAGFTAFFAGGSVRDKLLGREAKDYDIATSATPDQIEALFPKTVAVGKAFGVIVVVEDGTETEVATFRADGGYQDGRRPDSIEFYGAEEDAKRRDFTVNGMFYDPVEDKVIDYVGGQIDLEKKIIRAIGDPDRRFAEDHLRMLRAVRFAHTLGFEIEPATRAAIQKHAPDLAKISAERIENEFSRTLTESLRPGDALKELVDLGLINYIMPEILPMIGQEQPPQFHPEGDVFVHTCLMLNLMKNPVEQTLLSAHPFRPVEQTDALHASRRRLPHWEQDSRIYFVTFRLADSIAQEKLSQWQEELENWRKQQDEPDSEKIASEQSRLYHERQQEWLDKGCGSCILKNLEIAEIVEQTLLHFDGERYRLGSYVIMPNHVHLIVEPLDRQPLSSIMQSWKGYSAREINKVTGSKGTLWMDESFDHIIRNEASLEKFTAYIIQNPVKAHLAPTDFRLEKGSLSKIRQAGKPASHVEQAFQPAHPSNFKKLLAYTALLHDIGKPATAFMGEDRLRFHGHERKSAEMAEEILRRLKLPAKEIRQIVTAIDGHMRFKDVQKMNKATLRKLMGAETFDLELELHRLDCSGSHRMLDNYHYLHAKAEEMKNEPILPERWITGKDMKELGVSSGPRMGELIQLAYDAQLEGRFPARAALLDWLKTQI
jgi:putative nucleotidyltransferase with HDIG domain